MSLLVKADSAVKGDEVELTLTSELLSELGVEQGATLVIDAVDGTLIVRRATVTDQTAGMGTQWKTISLPTPEEEDEALAQAIAENHAWLRND